MGAGGLGVDELLCANLGRWHVTAIDAGIGGVALPPGGVA
jgi:hypothetical protein